MIRVYYFSGAGHAFAIAERLSELLNAPLISIEFALSRKNMPPNKTNRTEETAIAVFPVYCQNIPKPVKRFFKELTAARVAIVAVYGGFSAGNVLYEAARSVRGKVVAAAAVPTGHSLLSEPNHSDEFLLLRIAERVQNPAPVRIPKRYKNPFSDFFPSLRSRLGVKIARLDKCKNCGVCETVCPFCAIRGGKTNLNCVRCLKCVHACPENALKFTLRPILKRYLHGKRKNRFYFYDK